MNIIDAMKDPNLFGMHFQPIENWEVHQTIVGALHGLDLNRKQRRIYRKLTDREYDKTLSPREVWMIMGRRSGKSKITAFIAVYTVCFLQFDLSLGETGVFLIIATDRAQAKIDLDYCAAMLLGSPILKNLMVRRTADSIELSNGLKIMVATCSIRSIRGYTLIGFIGDEVAFWRDESSAANPAKEVINSAIPAAATQPNARFYFIGSPYVAFGVQYEAHRDHFGKESPDVLVFKAGSQFMNPTFTDAEAQRIRDRDPEAYRSEIEADFRTGMAGYLVAERIDLSLCLPNVEIPCLPHPRARRAFVDKSGGVRDRDALAIARMEPEDDNVYVDAIYYWTPPNSPDQVVEEMVEVLRRYNIASVTGDFYGAEITRELFTKRGISYVRSEESASEIYLLVLPLFNTGRVRCPDNPILRRELTMLERHPRNSGKDLVTHPNGQRDDVANATAGAILHAWRTRGATGEIVSGPSLVTAHYEGSLVTDHNGSWPTLT